MSLPSMFLPTRLAALVIGVAVASGPAAAENVLRFKTAAGGPHTLDPHSGPTKVVDRPATDQIYEALLDVDSTLAIVPQLALTWEPLNQRTWVFELRPDVRFHDGTPLTVEDVVFSIDRARAETSELRQRLGNIATVEALDDDTVQITTAEPDPLIWLNLAHVAIMSKAWAERHGAATAGADTYASRHANGTGPFMFEAFDPGTSFVLVRNPDWWGAEDYPHNIDRIVQNSSGDPEQDLQALIDGELDLVQDPDFASLERIRSTPGLKLGTTRKLLTHFFGMDQGSAELRSSDVKGSNPFKDVRVRRAMYHAIDLEAILGELMGDLLAPAGMLIPYGVNGYAPEFDQRLPHDPTKAKALLVEAGYPDGFSVTLDCPSDWGDDQIVTCEGAAAQLGEIGIDVTVNFLPTEPLFAKLRAGQSDFYLDSWVVDPDSGAEFGEFFQSDGRQNYSGYANPKVDQLIEMFETEIVTYGRDAYLEKAWRIVTEDLVYQPINYSVTVWAMREALEIPIDPWGIPRFRLARLKDE